METANERESPRIINMEGCCPQRPGHRGRCPSNKGDSLFEQFHVGPKQIPCLEFTDEARICLEYFIIGLHLNDLAILNGCNDEVAHILNTHTFSATRATQGIDRDL